MLSVTFAAETHEGLSLSSERNAWWNRLQMNRISISIYICISLSPCIYICTCLCMFKSTNQCFDWYWSSPCLYRSPHPRALTVSRERAPSAQILDDVLRSRYRCQVGVKQNKHLNIKYTVSISSKHKPVVLFIHLCPLSTWLAKHSTTIIIHQHLVNFVKQLDRNQDFWKVCLLGIHIDGWQPWHQRALRCLHELFKLEKPHRADRVSNSTNKWCAGASAISRRSLGEFL